MERQPHRVGVVIACFATMALVSSPAMVAVGVLFTPWIKEFHWNHGQVAQTALALSLVGGLLAPVMGWLVDNVGAHRLMAFGCVLVAAGYLAVTQVSSHWQFVALYGVIGLGVSLTSFLPIMVVVVNWFRERRGLFAGIVTFGVSLGFTVTPPLFTLAIARWSWRASVAALSLPAIVISLPLILLYVRTRPPSAHERNDGAALPGLEVRPALRTAAFRRIIAAQFLYGLGFSAVFFHTIAYAIGAGYTPEHGALILSAQTLVSAPAVVVMGLIADRISARRTLMFAMISVAAGTLALLGASSRRWGTPMIALFAPLFGGGASCVPMLIAILMAESLGLRRLGTLTGVQNMASALAMAFGPWICGVLFDLTNGYALPFELAAVCMVLGAVTVATVRPALATAELEPAQPTTAQPQGRAV